MDYNNDRMNAILDRLNAVMEISSSPTSTTNVNSKYNSSTNGCKGWDCFSKLNEVNETAHKEDVQTIKEHNNVFYDSWWQGGSDDSIHWEAAALGLASIFIGLGMVGLLLSICSACLRQRRAQMLISRQSRKRESRKIRIEKGRERFSAIADGWGHKNHLH